MAQKTSEANPASGPGAVNAANATTKAQQVRQVEQVGKTEKAALNKVNPAQDRATVRAAPNVAAKPEVSGTTNMMMKMMSDLEKGQGVLDKLISGGLSGKEFNSSELLALQAGMYKYTQELELTGKVVEKATTGLKDTLKTQV
jgi:hypothetical protein